MIVPGRVCACIIGKSVARVRLGTISMCPRAGVLVVSTIPNTQILFTGGLPLWNWKGAKCKMYIKMTSMSLDRLISNM